jgi:hypothetical protein
MAFGLRLRNRHRSSRQPLGDMPLDVTGRQARAVMPDDDRDRLLAERLVRYADDRGPAYVQRSSR